MLGKLRFKSAMFEGVLDNGEDSIFLGEGSRLTQMMDALGEIMEDKGAANQAENVSSDNTDRQPDSETPQEETQTAPTQTTLNFTTEQQTTADVVTETEQPREENNDIETTEADIPTEEQPAATPNAYTNPKDLITQGASFLSGLAATLKSPEATQQLVDTLVHTDKETGKTTLNIPVPDKQSVKNNLDLVGKLFG